ncbi:inner nuclear membrane protein Ima1 [Schizosaccharomyces pombe]|uniref:Integral inner nuclear membrane protein ima1 n=1 Tax=Schizosaccharomyces pombe (strain 972 / ATCC 24843) TaxID=284812 RepID=IINMP_SCHPO|nr:integral inner nuclear membrane protein Ima1 [Schizosaccharomyces pombe]O13681.2 RecName: Full=Integral inner nuclear membrane protein ima1 [Schizosaccharomyces pombe 972h-]CAA20860.1 integral inner nuclear membrane protein Ima1 [Schizosaccharomyces pombe]|eukprot:NP_588365.1 integral inner nuclear membrane protein Ima1 [Schizosaccharomyces pombe]
MESSRLFTLGLGNSDDGLKSTFGDKTVTCFYCNKKKEKIRDGTSTWTCSICEATNHIDEKGDILDYRPPTPTQDKGVGPFYAIRDFPSSSSFQSPFCEKCQMNQLIVNRMLADYLPDSSHPDYQAYEKALPEYKKSIEEKFPIVCSECYDSVQDQLDANDYEAKNQVLGYWLQKSKEQLNAKVPHHYPKASFVLWLLRGFGFSFFYLQSIVWHLYHSMIISLLPDGIRNLFLKAISYFLLDGSSSKIFYFNWLGFFVVFWNPYWYKMMDNPSWELFGRDQYIQCQALYLIIRLTCLYLLSCYESEILNLSSDTNLESDFLLRQIHAAFFFVTICFTWISISCLKPSPPPEVHLTGEILKPRKKRQESTSSVHRIGKESSDRKDGISGQNKLQQFATISILNNTNATSHLGNQSVRERAPEESPMTFLQKKMAALPTSSPVRPMLKPTLQLQNSPLSKLVPQEVGNKVNDSIHTTSNQPSKFSLNPSISLKGDNVIEKNLPFSVSTLKSTAKKDTGKAGDGQNREIQNEPVSLESHFSKSLALQNDPTEVIQVKNVLHRNRRNAKLLIAFTILFLVGLICGWRLNRFTMFIYYLCILVLATYYVMKHNFYPLRKVA